jgi:ABC-type transport system involved in multi-copper enzyme maturation permease subunit
MRSLINLTRAETFKLVKQPLTWLFLLALLLITGLSFRNQLNHAQEPTSETSELENPFYLSPEESRQAVVYPGAFQQVQVQFQLPVCLLLLLTVATVGQEFDWGTIRTALARAPGRGGLLVARLGALAAVAVLYLVILWTSYTLLGLWASYRLDGGVNLSFIDSAFFVEQLAMLIRIWLVTLPVIALGLLVAVWTRNAAMSITLGGMAYFLAWTALMFFFTLVMTVIVARAVEAGQDAASVDLGIMGIITTLSPIYNLDAVVHWGDMGMMGTDATLAALTLVDIDLPHGPWRGLALLSGYGVLSLLLAGWLLWQKDVTA